jgi:curved DNA-binding protein CbpA
VNYHELLGVPVDATEQEIRAAYRRIALRCHPDRTEGDPKAEALFHKATEAYRVLTHPGRRLRYEIESGLVESVHELFERKPIGKRLMKSVLPSARNAPRAGKSWIQAVVPGRSGAEADVAGRLRVDRAGSGYRIPLLVGLPPAARAVSWYELEGLGEPGKNGGEPGALWLMIMDGGENDGT